eukprot:Tbor_TRINITY_DN4250_c0_g1::TRINITY_DN4250_c0_g1_i1::g.24022::m.24022
MSSVTPSQLSLSCTPGTDGQRDVSKADIRSMSSYAGYNSRGLSISPPVDSGTVTPREGKDIVKGDIISAGRSVYNIEEHFGLLYAVLQGKTIDNHDYVHAVVKARDNKKCFFVHVPTKEKYWELPDIADSPHQEAPAVDVTANPWRQRFIAFYKKYNPSKISYIDPTLAQHPGTEELLMKALVYKYGPEPDHEDEYQGIVAEVTEIESKKGGNKSGPNSPVLDYAMYKEYKARLVRILKKYRPDLLPKVDKLISKYKNNYDGMIQYCVNKYGPEPPLGEVDGDVVAGTEQIIYNTGSTDSGNKEDQITGDSNSNNNNIFVVSPRTIDRHVDYNQETDEARVSLREQSLMEFLQDREARLEVVLARNDDLVSEISQLSTQNEALQSQIRELKAAIESEAIRMKGEMEKIVEERVIEQKSWEVEKNSIHERMSVKVAEMQEKNTEEQMNFEDNLRKLYLEKGNLTSELSEYREESMTIKEKISNLVSALDRRQIANLKLQKENEEMQKRLDPRNYVNSSSQTGDGDNSMYVVSDLCPLTYDARGSNKYAFDLEVALRRLYEKETEIQQLKRECSRYIGLIEDIREGVSERGAISPKFGDLVTSPSLERTPLSPPSASGRQDSLLSLDTRLHAALSTISSLRSTNKMLEGRLQVADMHLIAQPDADSISSKVDRLKRVGLYNVSSHQGEASVSDPEEYSGLQFTEVQMRLSSSLATINVQRKEIIHLRGLLANHLSLKRSGSTNPKNTNDNSYVNSRISSINYSVRVPGADNSGPSAASARVVRGGTIGSGRRF